MFASELFQRLSAESLSQLEADDYNHAVAAKEEIAAK